MAQTWQPEEAGRARGGLQSLGGGGGEEQAKQRVLPALGGGVLLDPLVLQAGWLHLALHFCLRRPRFLLETQDHHTTGLIQHRTSSGAETLHTCLDAPERTVCLGPAKVDLQAFLQPPAGLTLAKPRGLCGCTGTRKDSTSTQLPACKGWGEGDTRPAVWQARQGSRRRPLQGGGEWRPLRGRGGEQPLPAQDEQRRALTGSGTGRVPLVL